ncbi:MAG: hypothetical protein ACR2HA_06990 [Nocardioides sp.]
MVLTAWELPGQQEERDRRRLFECGWAVDPAAVRDAIRTCAPVAASRGVPNVVGEDRVRASDLTPSSADPAAVGALFRRMVCYVDRA